MLTDTADPIVFLWMKNILATLWSEPAGQIFLVTATFYYVSYVFYGGYLSFFTGFGGFPFSYSDFTFGDLITLFPAVVIAAGNILRETSVKILVAIAYYFGLPILIAIGLSELVLPDTSMLFQEFFYWLGLFIFLSSTFYSMTKSNLTPLSKTSLALFVIATGGLTIVVKAIDASSSSTISTSVLAGLFTSFFGNIFATGSIITVLLIPLFIGNITGRTAVKEKFLSIVERIDCSMPIFSPLPYKTIINDLEETTRQRSLFAKPGSDRKTNEVYSYEFQDCKTYLFLISSLRNFTVFFSTSDIDKITLGRMLIVSNSIILTMRTCSYRRKTSFDEMIV